jgi:aminoglycoside phosphotransferase
MKADTHPRGNRLTSFDPLSVLSAAWRADIAGRKLVPVTSGMSGAHVYRMRDHHAGDQYLKIAVGTDAITCDARSNERNGWHRWACGSPKWSANSTVATRLP